MELCNLILENCGLIFIVIKIKIKSMWILNQNLFKVDDESYKMLLWDTCG